MKTPECLCLFVPAFSIRLWAMAPNLRTLPGACHPLMGGQPPQSSTLFHSLQLRPTAVETLTFLSAINLLGMKARCSLCLRHAKNLGETWSRWRSSGSPLELRYARNEGEETICISKQLRRCFLLATKILCTQLGSLPSAASLAATFEQQQNLCHWC